MVSALPGSPDTPHEECYLRRTGRYRPFLSTDVVTSLEVMMMMMDVLYLLISMRTGFPAELRTNQLASGSSSVSGPVTLAS